MPQIIDDAVRNSLSPGVPALPDGTVRAHDVEGRVLPSEHYDKANSWEGTYDWDEAPPVLHITPPRRLRGGG